MSAQDIFGQLAAQDEARQQHDQSIAPQGSLSVLRQVAAQDAARRGQSTGDIFDQLAANGGNLPEPQTPTPTGEVKNDIGKTVIVPEPGESVQDTMNRAVVYGKKVTKQHIADEMATAPKKAAEVLAAAPVIGAVGAAGIAAGDVGLWHGAKALGYATEAVKDALTSPLGRKVVSMAIERGLDGAGFAAGYGVLKKLGLL